MQFVCWCLQSLQSALSWASSSWCCLDWLSGGSGSICVKFPVSWGDLSIIKAVFYTSVLMLFALCWNRHQEPLRLQRNRQDSYCKFFCFAPAAFCVSVAVKTEQTSSVCPVSRTRAEPQQKRGRTTRTQVWRGRSPGQSPGLCCRRPSPGWPRPPPHWKTRTVV